MFSFFETNQKPRDEKEGYKNFAISRLELDQYTLTAFLREKKYPFYKEKFNNLLGLSGIDGTEEFRFKIIFNDEEKSLKFSDDIPQSLHLLHVERMISDQTFQQCMEKVVEFNLNAIHSALNYLSADRVLALRNTISGQLKLLEEKPGPSQKVTG